MREDVVEKKKVRLGEFCFHVDTTSMEPVPKMILKEYDDLKDAVKI